MIDFDTVSFDGVNPEPWTAPTASVGRSGGRAFVRMHKSEALRVYQEAVKAEFRRLRPELEPTSAPIELTFVLWRQRTQYQDSAKRTRTKNAADATNMQKALEDALQGVLFENDRQVVSVCTRVMAQGIDVEPRIIIGWKVVVA